MLAIESKRTDMTEIHSVAMATYRFFGVDDFGTVMSVQWIECVDDAEAQEIALSLRTEIRGIEVWDVGRRICKFTAH